MLSLEFVCVFLILFFEGCFELHCCLGFLDKEKSHMILLKEGCFELHCCLGFLHGQRKITYDFFEGCFELHCLGFPDQEESQYICFMMKDLYPWHKTNKT